jgi:hypothetical protein
VPGGTILTIENTYFGFGPEGVIGIFGNSTSGGFPSGSGGCLAIVSAQSFSHLALLSFLSYSFLSMSYSAYSKASSLFFYSSATNLLFSFKA